MTSNYTPPYTITTKVVNLISHISAELTKLEFNILIPLFIAKEKKEKNVN